MPEMRTINSDNSLKYPGEFIRKNTVITEKDYVCVQKHSSENKSIQYIL